MLDKLPDEILIYILSNLNPAQLAKVQLICKKLNELVTPREFINSAAKYIDYRSSYTISDKINAFQWDRKAELFQKMKKDNELRTNFGHTSSIFTVTHQDKVYIIKNAASNKHLGYFGSDCYKAEGYDKNLPVSEQYIDRGDQIAVLIQDKYVLISNRMSSITLFDGEKFTEGYLGAKGDKLKGLKDVDTFPGGHSYINSKTLAILSLGNNKFLTVSENGTLIVCKVSVLGNDLTISSTGEFHQVELLGDKTVQRATHTKNNNILLACSDSTVIIIEDKAKFQLIKEMNLSNYSSNEDKLSRGIFFSVSNHHKPCFWPLIESLSKHNLIIIPPTSDNVLVIDETKDFAIHQQGPLPGTDFIKLGIVLESGEILLVASTNFTEKDLEIHFSYQNTMPNNCTIL